MEISCCVQEKMPSTSWMDCIWCKHSANVCADSTADTTAQPVFHKYGSYCPFKQERTLRRSRWSSQTSSTVHCRQLFHDNINSWEEEEGKGELSFLIWCNSVVFWDLGWGRSVTSPPYRLKRTMLCCGYRTHPGHLVNNVAVKRTPT